MTPISIKPSVLAIVFLGRNGEHIFFHDDIEKEKGRIRNDHIESHQTPIDRKSV